MTDLMGQGDPLARRAVQGDAPASAKQRNDAQRFALAHPKGRALARRGGATPRL